MTNSGTALLCINMLASAEKAGLDRSLFTVYCLDYDAAERMSAFCPNIIRAAIGPKHEQVWSCVESSGFAKIVRHKWRMLGEQLAHDDVCWLDADTVILRDPRKALHGNRILVQTESFHEQGNNLCTGIMYLPRGGASDEFLERCLADKRNYDQAVANSVALTMPKDVFLLSPKTFPNGCYIQTKGLPETACIAHCNFALGVGAKVRLMRQHKLWMR